VGGTVSGSCPVVEYADLLKVLKLMGLLSETSKVTKLSMLLIFSDPAGSLWSRKPSAWAQHRMASGIQTQRKWEKKVSAKCCVKYLK
jgi:hypothetical protein